MPDAQYSDATQKCNSQSANHENVVNDRDALATYLEDYAVWLSRARTEGKFAGAAVKHVNDAAADLFRAAAVIRASIKEDV